LKTSTKITFCIFRTGNKISRQAALNYFMEPVQAVILLYAAVYKIRRAKCCTVCHTCQGWYIM